MPGQHCCVVVRHGGHEPRLNKVSYARGCGIWKVPAPVQRRSRRQAIVHRCRPRHLCCHAARGSWASPLLARARWEGTLRGCHHSLSTLVPRQPCATALPIGNRVTEPMQLFANRAYCSQSVPIIMPPTCQHLANTLPTFANLLPTAIVPSVATPSPTHCQTGCNATATSATPAAALTACAAAPQATAGLPSPRWTWYPHASPPPNSRPSAGQHLGAALARCCW